MTVRNTLSVADARLIGVIVFSASSNIWVFGFSVSSPTAAVLIAVNSNFEVLSN